MVKTYKFMGELASALHSKKNPQLLLVLLEVLLMKKKI